MRTTKMLTICPVWEALLWLSVGVHRQGQYIIRSGIIVISGSLVSNVAVVVYWSRPLSDQLRLAALLRV